MPFKPNLNILSGSALTEYNSIISQIDAAASSSYTGGWEFSVSLSGSFTGSAVIGAVRDVYMSQGKITQRRWSTVEFANPTSGTTLVTLYAHNGRNRV